jgi:hypothetical protein
MQKYDRQFCLQLGFAVRNSGIGSAGKRRGEQRSGITVRSFHGNQLVDEDCDR